MTGTRNVLLLYIKFNLVISKPNYPSNSCWTAILTVGDDIATATKEALIKIR